MSATQDWYIDLTCTLTSPIDPDTTLTITEHLAAAYAVASIADDGTRLELSMTINAPNVIDAAVRARALVYGLELAQIDAIDALEVRTEEERDRQLATPAIPELVGTSEIAAMAGVTRQHVFNLARGKGFPKPLQRIGGQDLRSRAAVEHWLKLHGHLNPAAA
ncbi:conserved hypothetical protein [Micrococcus luteus]|uniref:helix-turn-helix transcriptional regulator n=1 Tax=Micrococcus luteus TaxID=1270 RepID=UPI0012EF6B2D|nr:hypothetical protein [Micrococcus luteus]MCV7609522.1 hypothetical protein [Micrococcus luteus]VWX51439.1 conserved hypothetical protein [Micrococcus luteus]